MQVREILGYDVYAGGLDACVKEVIGQFSTPDRCQWLACINPHSYIVARHDVGFSRALKNADWLIPDGAGMQLASRILYSGQPLERITGMDFFLALLQALNERRAPCRAFFLGSSETTLATIRDRMAGDFSNVVVAGTYSPPFKASFTEQEVTRMIETVNSSRPDILWVGMTAPKQEKWIYENRGRLRPRFAAAVGAVFDFYGGGVARAPRWMQRAGLEWIHRSVKSPGRLGRRNLSSNPKFVGAVLRAFLQKDRSQS